MFSKDSFINTYKLFEPANVVVTCSQSNKILAMFAKNIACYFYADNEKCFYQYYAPKSLDEITKTIEDLPAKFNLEHHHQLKFLIVDLDKISSKLNCENLSEMLSKLNELSKINKFKTLVALKSNALLEKVYSNFTAEQKSQILMLTMYNENPIRLVVETGVNKGKNIFYEVYSELEFMKEIN